MVTEWQEVFSHTNFSNFLVADAATTFGIESWNFTVTDLNMLFQFEPKSFFPEQVDFVFAES